MLALFRVGTAFFSLLLYIFSVCRCSGMSASLASSASGLAARLSSLSFERALVWLGVA